nr:DNA repair protein UVH3 isoform X2 [Tanacetum cinerariifolium]
KRISKAVKGIAGSKSSELIDHDNLHPANGKKRKKVDHEKGKDDLETGQLAEDSKFLIHEGHGKKTKKGSSVRGKGRGRGRGRGRGQVVGRGTRKKNNIELSGTSSDDGNNSDYVQEVDEHTKGQRGVRKSKRVKKSVIATIIEDSEDDEPKIPEDHAEVAGNEEPSNLEETLVDGASVAVGGSNDYKSPVSGSGIHPDNAELDKDWWQNEANGPAAELSEDYLKMGGGFCADAEGDKTMKTSSELSGSGIHPDNAVLDKDWCQNDANGPAAELSEDYLKMGGGFCADEEGDKEPGKSGCSPLTEELTEASNLGEAEASISPNAAIDLTATASLETNKVNDVIRPVTFLSAMPNLRRKRKKV